MTVRKTASVLLSVCWSLSALAVVATVFVVAPELWNGTVSGKFFWFFAAQGAFAAMTWLGVLAGRGKGYAVCLLDLLVVLFVGYVAVNYLVALGSVLCLPADMASGDAGGAQAVARSVGRGCRSGGLRGADAVVRLGAFPPCAVSDHRAFFQSGPVFRIRSTGCPLGGVCCFEFVAAGGNAVEEHRSDTLRGQG